MTARRTIHRKLTSTGQVHDNRSIRVLRNKNPNRNDDNAEPLHGQHNNGSIDDDNVGVGDDGDDDDSRAAVKQQRNDIDVVVFDACCRRMRARLSQPYAPDMGIVHITGANACTEMH